MGRNIVVRGIGNELPLVAVWNVWIFPMHGVSKMPEWFIIRVHVHVEQTVHWVNMPVNKLVEKDFVRFFLWEVDAMGQHNDVPPWCSVEIRQPIFTWGPILFIFFLIRPSMLSLFRFKPLLKHGQRVSTTKKTGRSIVVNGFNNTCSMY